MKKISNNAFLGKISMLLNVAIIVFFIIAMVFLLKFDKINRDFVDISPKFNKANLEMHDAKQPSRYDSVMVAFYTAKLDSLQAIPAPTVKADAKALTEEIARVGEILTDKKAEQHRNDSILKLAEADFLPLKTKYDELTIETTARKGTYLIFIWITIVLLIVKIGFFAAWNFKNSKNLHAAATWMKDGNKPFWAFLGWIIPIYNLIKPYNFFYEIWNETDYVLKEKSIVAKDKTENDSDFMLGMWWGLTLISLIGCSVILHFTFFADGPMYWKLSHVGVVSASCIFWILTLLIEAYIIRKYNKLNKILADNESKF